MNRIEYSIDNIKSMLINEDFSTLDAIFNKEFDPKKSKFDLITYYFLYLLKSMQFGKLLSEIESTIEILSDKTDKIYLELIKLEAKLYSKQDIEHDLNQLSNEMKLIENSYYFNYYTYLQALDLWKNKFNRENAYKILLELNKKNDNIVLKLEILISLAYLSSATKDLDHGIEFLEEAIKVCEKVGSNRKKARILNDLSRMYVLQSNLEKPISFLNEALDIYEVPVDNRSIANTMSNLGLVYKARGEFQIAKGYLEKSLDIRVESELIEGIGISYFNIAELQELLGEFETAEYQYAKAYQFFEASKSDFKYIVLEKYASQQFNRGDLIGALIGLKELKSWYDQQNKKFEINNLLLKIGIIEFELGNIDLAFNLIQSAKETFQDLKSSHLVYLCNFYLIVLHLRLSNPTQARIHFESIRKTETEIEDFKIRSQIIIALLEISEGRLTNLAKAYEILNNLLLKDTIPDELYSLIVVHLLELLYNELKIKKSTSIFSEAKSLIVKSLDMSNNRNIFLKVELMLYNAKFALLEANYDTSSSYLVKAKNLSLQTKSIRLINEIELFETKLINEMKINDYNNNMSMLNSHELLSSAESPDFDDLVSITILDFSKQILHIEAFHPSFSDNVIRDFIVNRDLIEDQLDEFNHHYYLTKMLKTAIAVFQFNTLSFSTVKKAEEYSFLLNLLSHKRNLSNNDFERFLQILNSEDTDSLQQLINNEDLLNQINLNYLSKIFHPIKMLILRYLYEYGTFISSDLRKILNVKWGTLSSHLINLENNGYIETKKEMINQKPTNVIYLNSDGIIVYKELRILIDKFTYN